MQMNGKKRGLGQTDVNINEKELIKIVKSDNNLNKYLNKKEIKKIIFIKNKLMNIII